MTYEKGKLLEEFSSIVKYGDFTLSSGKKSDFYIDCKELLLTPGITDLIGLEIHSITFDNEINFLNVAGLTSGADPIVCAVVMNLRRNGLFIRKQQKGHGTKKLIEGRRRVSEEIHKTTLIVDDVLTTGDSLRYSYEVLKQHDYNPVAIIVLVDREENDAKQLITEELKIPVYSIMTRSELLNFPRYIIQRVLKNK